jgi:hypothetical protein
MDGSMKNPEELEKQIRRFQSFKERTGVSKSSSYSVHISFSSYDDNVFVELGGYDVGGWSRHESFDTTMDNLVSDLTKKVDEADDITRYERWCPSCKEYTDHDPETGKCQGYIDWDQVSTCDEVIEV